MHLFRTKLYTINLHEFGSTGSGISGSWCGSSSRPKGLSRRLSRSSEGICGDWVLCSRDWLSSCGDWALTTGVWVLTIGDWELSIGDWALFPRDWESRRIELERRFFGGRKLELGCNGDEMSEDCWMGWEREGPGCAEGWEREEPGCAEGWEREGPGCEMGWERDGPGWGEG